MKNIFSIIVGLVAVVSWVGCGEGMLESGATDDRADEITNGKVDTGHPSVGKLYESGQGICTATLIGAKTVLCAAHCITSSASAYSFVVGGKTYAAQSVTVHPSWNGSYNNGEGKNDLSVIILKTAPTVTPTPITTTAPFAGQVVTLVGYGVTSDNVDDYGTKRIAHNVITSLASTVIYWDPGQGTYQGQSTCYGDSGGPAFATVNGVEVQVGITSGGSEPCDTGYSWDTNVYLFASWISQVAGGDVVKPGANSCTPNCSGKVCGSDGCGGTCGACATGTTCNASGQCAASGGTTPAACSHAICSTGAKLVASCDTCAAKICAQDSYCCNNSWDATCVKEVASICSQSCSGGTTPTPPPPAGTCSHALCTKGSKLTSTCNTCVKQICAQDSYCCNTAWDATCVGEVASVCGQTC
jgi:V8-like Glu-specific endopeptidase